MSAAGGPARAAPCFDRADLMTMRGGGFADSLAHAKPRRREGQLSVRRAADGSPRV